ncbi:hypothetical protein CUS10_14235 [Enterococcus faecium]|nr:hypothetical protein [Enterococcus faecium]PQE58042.1 hypothetical protein CUS10_14235 [Enterococcus faecium]
MKKQNKFFLDWGETRATVGAKIGRIRMNLGRRLGRKQGEQGRIWGEKQEKCNTRESLALQGNTPCVYYISPYAHTTNRNV